MYVISGGRKGAALLFSKECVFLGTINAQFSVSFLSKFKLTYNLGGCKGKAPLYLRKFCILRAIICIISGPFWFKFTEIYDFW